MFYERKIKYLDYMQGGERIGGAGFVKIEVRETLCNITLQVSGLSASVSGEREVLLSDEEKEEMLGRIRLENGKGSLMLQGLGRSALGQSRISYDGLMAMRIPVNGNAEISCVWRREAPAKIAPAAERESPYETCSVSHPAAQRPEQEGISAVQREQMEEKQSVNREEPVKEENLLSENSLIPETQPDRTTESALNPPVLEQAGTAGTKDGTGDKMPVRKRGTALQESKWQQLAAIYPHIRPFHDERDYISIGPADFVIFSEKYYKMANNSFLLHGFYNYEHLILTRIEKRGEQLCYIGVPGSFYEREKQVAVMFGFESFECREEPAKQGDFGYYMMRVEI